MSMTIDAAVDTSAVAKKKDPATTPEGVDAELVGRLVEQARAAGLQLTGEGGLLQQLTKRVIEAAMDGEVTDHLGYDKHDPAGKDGGNSRNGTRAKTVLTDVGPVEISVPRDRDGSFEPQIVRKRQRRLTGVEDMVLSLSAKGLTTGEISAHLAEVYGADVSRQTISTITDKVVDGMAEWQNRPLDRVYPVVFLDAINVKIRDGKVANRPIYVALAVTAEGTRDILGLWAGDGGEAPSSHSRSRILGPAPWESGLIFPTRRLMWRVSPVVQPRPHTCRGSVIWRRNGAWSFRSTSASGPRWRWLLTITGRSSVTRSSSG